MNPVLDPFLHRLYTGAVDFRVLFWVGRFFNIVLLCLYTGAVDCRVRKGCDAPEPRRGTVPALASVVTRAPPTASRAAPAPLPRRSRAAPRSNLLAEPTTRWLQKPLSSLAWLGLPPPSH